MDTWYEVQGTMHLADLPKVQYKVNQLVQAANQFAAAAKALILAACDAGFEEDVAVTYVGKPEVRIAPAAVLKIARSYRAGVMAR